MDLYGSIQPVQHLEGVIMRASPNVLVNGIGDTIEEGADLNSLTKAGVYCSPSAATTATLVNSPTKAYAFRLEVKVIMSGRYLQILYPNVAGVFYIRNYLAAGWSSWYKFSGEEQTTV